MKLISNLAMIVAVFLFAGCGGSDDNNTNNDCQNGASQGCTCADGKSGSQTCTNGAWGDCTCTGCTDGQTQACTCAGGDSGAQVCTNATWGECDCSCTHGAIESCTCADGATGEKGCVNGSWSACLCEEEPECAYGEEKSCTCPDNTQSTQECNEQEIWGPCLCGPEVGSICQNDDDCQGGAQNMVCAFDNPDDDYGFCTITCSDLFDCIYDEIGQINWGCCEMANGPNLCGPPAWGC
jgi:hypothetical protein